MAVAPNSWIMPWTRGEINGGLLSGTVTEIELSLRSKEHVDRVLAKPSNVVCADKCLGSGWKAGIRIFGKPREDPRSQLA